jgi:uncharacterized protein (DUF1501 family)
MKRRNFLKGGLSSLAFAASNSMMSGGLGLLGNIASASSSAPTDYRSLVMVYLTGGLDSLGLLVPTDNQSYRQYSELRQNLAFARDSLIDFGLDGYATPDACQAMARLYRDGKLAWVSNVGPLSQPTTKTMIQNDDSVMPLFIASHNSQSNLWQSASQNPNARAGWGARMIEAMNLNSGAVTPNISLDSSQLFTTSLTLPTFTVNPEFVVNIPRVSEDVGFNPDAISFQQIQSFQRANLLSQEVAQRNLSTLENTAYLTDVLSFVPDTSAIYPQEALDNGLLFQQQLKMAARLIEAAPHLGHHRQLLMVQMHGWDTHDNQDRDLPVLLRSLFGNLEAFLNDLELRGLDDRVVVFNQSDFGRTATINANGTDHGWGGHYFVMGTPVRGGQVVGEIPEFGIETGKMLYNLTIPDISVEQYAANMARWFGLNRSQISEVFPNIVRFDDLDMGLF